MIKSNKTFFFWLGFVFILGITCYNSVGYYHPDEHFQILEFANWKLGKINAEMLPWEFKAKIRSSLQPSMVVLLYKICNVFFDNIDPFKFTFFLRILSALLFLLTIYMMIRSTKQWVITYESVYLCLLIGLWFISFVHIRFSSESWSSSFFALAIACFIDHKRFKFKYFLIGILLGFSFLLRFQIGIMIAGFFFWYIIYKRKEISCYENFFLILSGLLIIILFGIYLDYWFYGSWVMTSYNYLVENLINGRASTFGTDPFWYYIVQFLIYYISPFSIVLLFLILSFFIHYPKNLLTWTVGTFIIVHMLIPHKEIRFLIPVTIFIPLIVVLAWQKSKKIFPTINQIFLKWIFIVFGGINLVLLIIMMIRPADDLTSLYKKIYQFKGKTILFSQIQSPYHRLGFYTWFYRSPELIFNKIEEIKNLEQQLKKVDKNVENIILLTDKPISYNRRDYEKYLIYQLPYPFLYKINYFNWIEKSKLNKVFLYLIDKNLN